MLQYNHNLKHKAHRLRENMTDTERLLWSRLRRKQILGVQFYRQKPIGNYIVDFYAPKMKLVVEVDGAQHLEEKHLEEDKRRDAYLTGQGLCVLRFNNLQIFQELDSVMEVIYKTVMEELEREGFLKNPPLNKSPLPPFSKGE